MTASVDRKMLGDRIARAISPDAWREYDAGGGTCSNMAGWACVASIHAAGRVMDLLHEEGLGVPARGEPAPLDPTVPVHLTLDESGRLCHLLMAEIQHNRRARPSHLVSERALKVIIRRNEILYDKLTSANDVLMHRSDP